MYLTMTVREKDDYTLNSVLIKSFRFFIRAEAVIRQKKMMDTGGKQESSVYIKQEK